MSTDIDEIRQRIIEARPKLQRVVHGSAEDEGVLETLVEDAREACDEVERLRAEVTKLREVAQRVTRRFQVIGRAVPQSEPGGMVVQSRPYCEACEQSQCDEWCLRAMAERALANGGAGGGEVPNV